MKPAASDEPDDIVDAGVLTREQAWAMEKFEELGFSPFSASVLASVRADWHRAKKLLGKAEALGDGAHDFVFDQLT